MKVKDLIRQLEGQDPNADVVIWELIVGDCHTAKGRWVNGYAKVQEIGLVFAGFRDIDGKQPWVTLIPCSQQ